MPECRDEPLRGCLDGDRSVASRYGLINFCKMGFYVYILQSQNTNKFYAGQTENPVRRLHRHNAGNESYTASFRPWRLVWCTEKASRAEAIALEKKLKNLSRERLERFMDKFTEGLAMAKHLGTSPDIK